MLRQKAFKNITTLFVETHERFVDGESKETVAALLSEIEGLGVQVFGDWG
jgi:hypothetical protein